MFKLHIVQARYGDCFILEYGTAAAPRYILIDGGPQGVYEENLRPVLQDIADSGGSLDFAILSHVDNDHVLGLLDLLGEIQRQRHSGVPETITVGEIWHNSFGRTLGDDLEARFNRVVRATRPPAGPMRDGSMRGGALRDGSMRTSLGVVPGVLRSVMSRTPFDRWAVMLSIFTGPGRSIRRLNPP